MILKGVFFGLALALAQPSVAQISAADGLAALDAGDAEAARAIWEPLAARGDVLAQVNLGVLLLTGQGGAADPEAAHGLFEAAAEHGHVQAQRMLADLAVGRGDMALARRWYGLAAQAGDAVAQLSLGRLLDRGEGGDVDPQGARHWYGAAARQGLIDAQFAFAAALAEIGDHAQAADWFAVAADQGDPRALHNLAVAYAQGLGRGPDDAQARALYLRAAQAGHAPSMRNLALMQARGRGGAQSFRRALAWALTAATLEEPGAEDLVSALREVMSENAIAEAHALARECASAIVICD